jgi:NADH-quinone oxidoreductase subunit K
MLTLNVNYILTINSIIFLIGMVGIILNRKNLLTIIMSIELLLLAVNLNFAAISIYLDDITGQIFVLFILTVAAAESALGLSLITVFYQLKNSIRLEPIKHKTTNKI